MLFLFKRRHNTRQSFVVLGQPWRLRVGAHRDLPPVVLLADTLGVDFKRDASGMTVAKVFRHLLRDDLLRALQPSVELVGRTAGASPILVALRLRSSSLRELWIER